MRNFTKSVSGDAKLFSGNNRIMAGVRFSAITKNLRPAVKGVLLILLSCMSAVSFAQTTTLAGGDIKIGNISPMIINSNPTASNPIGSFSLVQSGSTANLTQVKFTTTGTYSAVTDVTNFTLYVNANGVNSLSGSVAVPSGTMVAGAAGLQTMNLSTPYALSTGVVAYYFFIVPTLGSSAVPGSTIATSSIPSTNIAVSAGSVSGSAAASGVLTILNPSITGSTGGSRCGTGTVTLSVTTTAGAIVNWFSASSGGSSLGSGTTFTTPSISSTTTYYAEVSQNATIQTGTLTDNTTNLLGNYFFDQRTDLHWVSTTTGFTINSVDFYPYTSGTAQLAMCNSTGAPFGSPISTSPVFTVTPAQVSNTVPVTMPVGLTYPAGATNYQLGGMGAILGADATMYRGVSTFYGPYPTNGAGVSLTGDAATGVFIGYGIRCYFYNWNITFPITKSPRVAVTATVNPVPTGVTASASPGTLCSGGNITLTGAATGATSVLWTGPGGTAIGSPTSLSTSVTGAVVANSGVYTLTATLGPCSVPASTSSVTVNALPAPTYTSSPGASSCAGVNVTYTTQAGQSNYTWAVPGVSGTDYTITSGGIGTASNTVTLQWITTGNKTVTVGYTNGSGCTSGSPATNTTSVNPSVASITGPNSVCGGTGPTTITLSDASVGGTWTSSNTALATVGSTTGVVTGVATGAPVITYTLPSGCFATTTVSVSSVAAITGLSSVCLGNSITLSDATGGGAWSSSNTGIATVNSSGVVSGASLGSVSISYSVASIGCSAVTTLNVTLPPNTFSVTGGGGYCAGGIGVHIGLNNSNAVTYYLFNGTTLVTTLAGTGSAIDFGLFTASGTYTVVANYGTTCAANMLGSAVVSVNPLPTAFSVGGGGGYCSGGSGANITLSSSTPGVNYQLMLGITPIGAPMVGTGSLLTFGPVTTAGTYTIIATNATTGCMNTMAGSATVTINALPTVFSITGGGGFCLGGSGVHIGVSGSTAGVNYQLLFGGSPVGAPLSGTGSALDFGLITVGGSYTVLATSGSTGCTNAMSGVATVTVNPLPTAFSVTGGGAYCSGGTGSVVGLNGSTIGVNYQLFLGTTPVGAPVAGTGVALSLGSQTTAGSYSVVATNVVTGCTNNMFGSASVSINPLPTVFTVTGGGGYCAGGAGVHIGLSSSVIGTNYSLFNGVTLVGAAAGTGSSLDFGLQLAAGTYTVSANNIATGCSGNMSGSVTVVINPLPTVNNVTGGGAYCAGGTGVVIGLNGSTAAINYQLYNGITPVGTPFPGSGAAISFGLQTGAGSYTVVAINPATTCTNNMNGSAVITINPLPIVYAMTGGGGYCSGGTGVHVGLAASNTGINYQLYNGVTIVGGPVAGTGAALDFGLITTVGTYTITATDATTLCTNRMSGASVVSINALPTAYAVTGGGPYCAGGSGVHVGVGNSTVGVNYQLFNGITPIGSPVAGSGSAIDFGFQTAAGTYTVVATNAATACTNNMTGSVTITVNSLPAVFTVTGGGTFCSGGTGVHVGLTGSVVGVNYQLMRGGLPVGSAVLGSGSALDFGLQTTAGTYTVVATNAAPCSSNMTGSVTVAISLLPGLNSVTGGGSYCVGGTGMHIGLNGSIIGVSYQLFNGGAPVGSPIAGTGLALDFGLQTAAGVYTIKGTNMLTGCIATMTGSKTITANPLPTVYTVTGGGSYCAGGTGMHVGLFSSDNGISYQLMRAGSPVGSPVFGSTGSSIDFGLETGAGIYTVVARDTATGCVSNMASSATIGIYPLPTLHNVTGGGSFCTGGAGVHVGLNRSDTGISYQLWYTGSPVGAAIPGSGLALDFGLQAGAGVYTVVATNNTTECTNTMSGSATVVVNPLPASHTVIGGGDYCAGGAGLPVGLDGSNTGTIYQLYNGLSPVGGGHVGTGSAISFGLQTGAGTYTVVATATGTTCVNVMDGSVDISIDPLPTPYPVTGGGSYCSGGAGLDISLSTSDEGISYQLYLGTTPVGLSIPGTGSTISFGLQTAPGVYTIVGSDMFTFCSINMSNTVTITINSLPTAYNVTGGGAYCAGGAGVHVRLSGSNAGISYQLMNGISTVGSPVMGTGMPIDFGLQTVAGTYSVVATNSTTTCINVMNGSATVIVNPLPIVYSVASDSTNYCAGGPGVHIWLDNSEEGINYQLYNGSTPAHLPIAGTGTVLDFGSYFTAGSYRILGVNAITGCTDTMASSVTIVINPLPTAYSVTGGGGYCVGGSGVHVGLSGSDTGIVYELFKGFTTTGIIVPGTGGVIDFGLQTASGSYSVVATNRHTNCTSNMSGSATVVVNSLPSVFSVSGGGNYCAGGVGIDVGLRGSATGVNYQLYNGLSVVGSPMAGTGSSLDFGNQTGAGTYTVLAINASTGCTNLMAGSAVVGINAAPNAWSVVGGGHFCATGSGAHVGISGSNTGISYQLLNGGTPSGIAMSGTGSAIDFGAQTAAGTYTVLATNIVTGCTNTMTGSANVVVDPLPITFTVMGGGSYCAGGSGLHIGLSNSTVGVNYILYLGTTAVTTVAGTGSPLDFGLQTAAGTYTVHAVNATTGCSADMTGSVSIRINSVVVPGVTISTPSTTICDGTLTTFTAVPVNGGGSPLYQWTLNGAATAVGSTYSYIPSNGDVIGVMLTSSAVCAIPPVVTASVTMTVDPHESPVVSVITNPGTVLCKGTGVTFTAIPTYGGPGPTYTWVKNGSNVGNTNTYSYIPDNGDVVFCVMNSNYHCALTPTATSSNINLEVDTPALPVVTIVASPGNTIAPGQAVTLTASVRNGGPTPTFQWLVNGVPVPGAITQTFVRSNFNNGDSATCQVISSGGCPGLLGFNSVYIHVMGVGVGQITSANADVKLVPNPNKGVFTVKGTLATSSDEEVSIEITDMLGQVVSNSKVVARNGEINEQINMGNSLANGMYILTLHSGTENKVFHLVIEQ